MEEEQSSGHYLLFVRLDVRTHLMIHHSISSEVYLVNLGIKSNIESLEGISDVLPISI